MEVIPSKILTRLAARFRARTHPKTRVICAIEAFLRVVKFTFCAIRELSEEDQHLTVEQIGSSLVHESVYSII